MTSYPKSRQLTKAPKKPKTRGVCPSCGLIFIGKPQHVAGCSQEIPVISFRKKKTDRQLYNEALDSLCRHITIWRDGVNCVLADVDGGQCFGVSQWGHVVAQGACGYLVHNLSNAFRQCATHNTIHRHYPLTYYLWYEKKFGKLALEMLDRIKKGYAGSGFEFSISDLQEQILHLSELYESRRFVQYDLKSLVKAGYYGPIIQEAWAQEGRI